MNYYTADWHLFHKNMRVDKNLSMTTQFPDFKDVQEYHEYIINLTNKYVTKKDTLYILGDLSLASAAADMEETANLLECLNAKKIILVKGNHDSQRMIKKLIKSMPENKLEVEDLGLRYKKDGLIFHLTHYPLLLGGRRHTTSINVHGHIHDDTNPSWNLLNVGIDSVETPWDWEFGRPWSEEEILKEMKRRRELSANLATKNP